MNTKIYCRDKFVEFMKGPLQGQQNQAFIYVDAVHGKKAVREIAAMLTDESDPKNIIVTNTDFSDVFDALKKEFHYIEAAGGFIEKNGEYLCIHRLGRWDLPKGKLEKGESIQEGAIRECQEECGIRSINIKHRLSSTFHVYPYKKSYAIKQSYWFYMSSDDHQPLTPQLEENIDEVRWFSKNEISDTVLKDTYYTIRDVISEALGL